MELVENIGINVKLKASTVLKVSYTVVRIARVDGQLSKKDNTSKESYTKQS